MHVTTLILSTGLALALAPAGVLGWAQAANGVWVASNTWYDQVGNYNNVHESCTRMNSQIVLTSGDCAYWTDGNGNQGHGLCYSENNRVGCYSCDEGGRSKCLVACQIGCSAAILKPCIAQCRDQCKGLYHCTSG